MLWGPRRIDFAALAATPEVLSSLDDAPMVVVLWARATVRTEIAHYNASDLAGCAEDATDEVHRIRELLEFDVAELPVEPTNLVHKGASPRVCLCKVDTVRTTKPRVLLHL